MSLAAPVLPVANPNPAERTFRRILIVFAAVAALGILGHLGMLLWAQNGFTGGECVVAAHSSMLVHEGTLYYDLNHYPYTVAPYTPLFYLADAALQKAGLPLYTAGRAISFLAALGIVALSWYLALLYTKDRYAAALSALLCASSSLLWAWGAVGQVDMLALFWTLTGFYLYSRYALLGENTLMWAAVCCLLAFFTKQTMLACPVAIFLLLFFSRRKTTALKFALGCLAVAAAIVFPLDAALGGRFLADTVRANTTPHSIHKLLAHLRYALLVAGPLLLVAGLGARKAIKTTGAAPFAYLGLASLVFLGSAAKIGSDLNYQLEFTVLLILCASLSLHALQFFSLSFQRTRTWVTLLQLPLGVFLLVNCRATAPLLALRYANERQTRVALAAVQSALADGGRVLSADYNSVVRLRGRLDVEMAFYNLLVSAGKVDPEPLRRDLARCAFSTIILMEDVRTDHTPLNIEISTLPSAQLAEIHKHYRLVQRIPGPFLDGMYVYKPRN
jgi:hypothetical protein